MKFDLQPVPKAKNLDRVGWSNGYVLVQFKGRPDRYIFGPAIPESEVSKVLKNPFPDRLFTTNIKNKFQCHKMTARD
jgi:hypothetical protein